MAETVWYDPHDPGGATWVVRNGAGQWEMPVQSAGETMDISSAQAGAFYGDERISVEESSLVTAQATVQAVGGEDFRVTHSVVSGQDYPVSGAGFALVVVPAAMIMSRCGSVVGPLLLRFLGAVGIIRAATWGSLPGWIVTLLKWLGFSIGTELVLEGAGVGEGLIPGDQFFPSNVWDLVGQLVGTELSGLNVGDLVPNGSQIVGSWVGNGTKFYRLADGRLACQNKKRQWKIWKPKKPVVIMPTGVSDLKDLLRADRIITAQVKRLRNMTRDRLNLKNK